MKALITIFFSFTVFISAIQVVVVQHEARKTFVELQRLEKTRDELNEEWGRLLLEQSTWATDDRIEMLARSKLMMVDPDYETYVLLAK